MARDDYWSCTIGPVARALLPRGADAPLRTAVEVVSSGWGAADPRVADDVPEQPIPKDGAERVRYLYKRLQEAVEQDDRAADNRRLCSSILFAAQKAFDNARDEFMRTLVHEGEQK
jgi:hypothetical protein